MAGEIFRDFSAFPLSFRHAAVVETSVTSCCSKCQAEWAVYLSHDLSMLRIIETFAESCPQLVLMLTIMLQEGRLDLVTGAVCCSCAHHVVSLFVIQNYNNVEVQGWTVTAGSCSVGIYKRKKP